MKKSLFFLLTIIYIFFITSYHFILAQEKNSSNSAIDEKQIVELKEKVASKVAELQKKNNQGRSGYITEIKNDFLSIQDRKNDIYKVSIDPIVTKYYQIINNQKKEIKKEDLSINQYVIIEGIISGNQIEANAVYIDENFLINSGRVIEINKNEYWIKVNTLEKETLILDIETYTKKYLLNIKTLNLENIGFSKIKEGDTVHFVIKKEKIKPVERASALRLIVIPQEFFLKQ